jgi:hypothetical protein
MTFDVAMDVVAMRGRCDDDMEMVGQLSVLYSADHPAFANFAKELFIGVNTHGVRWAFGMIRANEGS